MVVAELKITGVFPKEVIDKISNCVKSNVELVFPCDTFSGEGLTVEATILD